MSEIDALARRYAPKAVGESQAGSSEQPSAFAGPSSAEREGASSGQHDDDPSTSDGDFIEHIVSKSDTLAGLAIKHNVGVSDIKRANGLMSESMMWSRTKLLIPRAPLPLSDEAVMKYAALVNSGVGGGGSSRAGLSGLGSSSLCGASALDQLRSYYDLAPEPSYLLRPDPAPRFRTSNPDAPGDVEMMVRSPTAGTPTAATDKWVDERTQRLRKRGESEALDASTSGSSFPSRSGSSCMPPGCMPGPSEATPVRQVIASVRGAFLDTFGDIMEKPPHSGGAGPGPSRPGRAGGARHGSSASGPPGGAGAARAGPPRETFFQKIQRVSSQPALASGGPSVAAIGDGLLRGGRDARSGRDPLSADGSVSSGTRSVPPQSKGKAD